MGIGALMGLFYPTGLALLTGSDLFTDFFGVLSWGVWLFWLACIAAAVIAFQNAGEAPASVYQSSAPGYSPAYLSALTSRTLTIASSTSGQCAQTAGQAEMRESPDVSAIVLAQIPVGSTLTLQERVVWAPRPMWIKVMDDRSDTVGYVNGMSLKPG